MDADVVSGAQGLKERHGDRTLVLDRAVRIVVPAALGSLGYLDPVHGGLQSLADLAAER